MKDLKTRIAAAERLLRKEGMPAELPEIKGECLCDFRLLDYPNLQKVLDGADMQMEDFEAAVGHDPDGFTRWYHATRRNSLH